MKKQIDIAGFNKMDLFEPIGLEDIANVRLMNRADTKYWFHKNQLSPLLESVQGQYFILQMHEKVALPYSTMYYDTKTDGMFTAHHNGKGNRYSIRRRSYVSSGISFLEVKFKNNKGRTIKQRIPANFDRRDFNEEENSFIKSITPFSAINLSSTLLNNFSRITLVNKNFKERCTIDFELRFAQKGKYIALDNLVVLEIKSDRSSSKSPLSKTLRNHRIKKSGFSKYSIGRSILETNLKRNAFKEKIRMIEKTIKTEESLFNN